jgi:predicted dehydrogenase
LTRVRVGVIGAGSIAQQMHLPYLAELEDRFELVGVCDASASLARKLSARFGAPIGTSDHGELLSAGLDAVLIAVNGPSDEITAAALEAGCHVLVEKPLAYGPLQAARLRELAAAVPGRLMVGYMKRYDPIFPLASELVGAVREELCGGLVRCVAGPNELYIRDVAGVLRADDVSPETLARQQALRSSRIREAIGEVGPELELAYELILGITCHELSVLRGLIGPPRAVTSAEVRQGGRWVHAHLSYESFEISYVLGRLASRAFDEKFELYSQRETIELSFPSPFLKNAPTLLRRRADDGEATVEELYTGSYAEAFKCELEHFHACVVGSEQVATGAAEGQGDAEIMAAIVRAADQGVPQPIPCG